MSPKTESILTTLLSFGIVVAILIWCSESFTVWRCRRSKRFSYFFKDLDDFKFLIDTYCDENPYWNCRYIITKTFNPRIINNMVKEHCPPNYTPDMLLNLHILNMRGIGGQTDKINLKATGLAAQHLLRNGFMEYHFMSYGTHNVYTKKVLEDLIAEENKQP